MPAFHVTVRRDQDAPDPSPVDLEQDIQSQNASHAAVCGLSLAGGGYADCIEVRALRPAPGRSAAVTFYQCSQGIYGFCFGARS